MSKNGPQEAIMLTFSDQLLTTRSQQASFEVWGTPPISHQKQGVKNDSKWYEVNV